MTELLQTDVLIIGCGIAGATAALQLAEAGLDVTVITRAADPAETNTFYAQGGIIYRSIDDSPELLAKDILHAGAGHCNPRAVQILAEEGPVLFKQILLDHVGVPFDRSNGDLSLAREGGHSVPRIAHVADATGKAIEIALMKALQAESRIRLLTGFTAIDLLTPSHHSLDRHAVYDPQSCVGAYLLNQADNTVLRCLACHTILATGGLGQIYLNNTNPIGARGDGIAMAYRAGARVINMEFVQFHPTTFYQPNAPRFLITEAVRGDGGRLVNAAGEPFMQNYDAEWKDLAPRDVVSRSIYHEMLVNDVSNVFLDLRSTIPEARIREHFPNIYQKCLSYGVDLTHDLVPVVPGAHYSCGGVWVDEWGHSTIERLYAIGEVSCTGVHGANRLASTSLLEGLVWVDEWGHSTIDRLYAIGEVSCTGVHGANRLASTSLLEGLVWGKRAAQDIVEQHPDRSAPDPELVPAWQYIGEEVPDPALIGQDMSVIKNMMWNYVGLVRTTDRLNRALRELRHLETEIERFYRSSKLTDGLLGLRNAVRAAVIVTMAAWENKQSMGCHYRE